MEAGSVLSAAADSGKEESQEYLGTVVTYYTESSSFVLRRFKVGMVKN